MSPSGAPRPPVGAPLPGAEQRKGTPDLMADRQVRSSLRAVRARHGQVTLGSPRDPATHRCLRDERTSGGGPARSSRRATSPTTVPLVGAGANWMSRASLAAWAPGTGERCPQSAVRRSGWRHPLLDRPQHYTRHDRSGPRLLLGETIHASLLGHRGAPRHADPARPAC